MGYGLQLAIGQLITFQAFVFGSRSGASLKPSLPDKWMSRVVENITTFVLSLFLIIYRSLDRSTLLTCVNLINVLITKYGFSRQRRTLILFILLIKF
jgi:hypothetical protein